MDEVVFRASETIDTLQHHLRIAAGEGKAVLINTSGKLSDVFVKALHNSRYSDIKEGAVRYFTLLLLYANDFQDYVVHKCQTSLLYDKLSWMFNGKVTRREIIIGSTGVFVGIVIGYYATKLLPSKEYAARCMQAIQCLRYSGIEAVTVVDDARGPKRCNNNEVFINIKACSVNRIDKEICSGYGSRIRGLLIDNFKYCEDELPVTLGRDCAGIVIDVGQNVTRFEVGDMVWASTPFWAPGTMSQYVSLPEWQVAKMPELGFESATSIPFSGGTALGALNSVDLNVLNAEGKSVFVHGGCSAVGCLVVQILNYWGAKVTVSCYQRAVPVARALHVDDIIALVSNHGEDSGTKAKNAHLLKKELDLHEKFFAIIVTVPCELGINDLKEYCINKDRVVLTLPQPIPSDRYGLLRGIIFALYVKVLSSVQNWSKEGLKGYGETHICFQQLDKLAQYVNNGIIQSVVDRVFQPHEIDQALIHIQCLESIGSTVITFR